jgi:hypothetical protein
VVVTTSVTPLGAPADMQNAVISPHALPLRAATMTSTIAVRRIGFATLPREAWDRHLEVMKPYLITTGILFAAITVAHAYGAIARGHLHHTDLLVLVSAGLSFWAWRLLRTATA